MALPHSDGRWPGLDLLRAAAVFLVLGRHFENNAAPGTVLHFILEVIAWVGWAGVDLFFALSGFLISNLLFREYREFGKVRWQRFLVRRAFKIYPAFYVLIAVSVFGLVEAQGLITMRSVLGEILFLQNYVGSLWLHTWSLAVEEHFYFLITALVVLPWHAQIVQRWPVVVCAIAIGCLTARVVTGAFVPFYYDTHLQQTHVRIDGLFFGSLAGYLWNFGRTAVLGAIGRNRRAFQLITAGAIVVPFAAKLEDSFFVQTIGMTILGIGFGMLTLGCVAGVFQFRPGKVRSALEEVGRCSYGIYLWHFAIAWRLLPEVQSFVPYRIPIWAMFGFYVAACLATGIAMTRWVEAPALRLRDKFFPKPDVPRPGVGVALAAA